MTEFAKFTKMLRIENDEFLGHMAKKLGVSSAFLSRVENGLAKPSEKLVSGLCEKYCLKDEQKKELKDIVDRAREKSSITTIGLSPTKQQLVFRLAKSINYFDDEELAELDRKISQKEGGIKDVSRSL